MVSISFSTKVGGDIVSIPWTVSTDGLTYIDNACCVVIRLASGSGIELLLYEVSGRNEANLILQGRGNREPAFYTCFYYTAGSSSGRGKAFQDARDRAEGLLMERSEEARRLLKKSWYASVTV